MQFKWPKIFLQRFAPKGNQISPSDLPKTTKYFRYQYLCFQILFVKTSPLLLYSNTIETIWCLSPFHHHHANVFSRASDHFPVATFIPSSHRPCITLPSLYSDSEDILLQSPPPVAYPNRTSVAQSYFSALAISPFCFKPTFPLLLLPSRH